MTTGDHKEPGLEGEAAAAGDPLAPGAGESPRRTSMPTLTMAWHESWILRAAGVAAFILLLGYVSSAFFAFESIDAIAKLAHDEQIEASLGAHLETIKKAH